MTSVAVFAHNEEANILACLRSLDLGPDIHATVLANGCTDHTADIVRSANLPHVTVVELVLGDKANALNVFIERYADPAADMCAFVDGDVTASSWALEAMRHTLASAPRALAVAAVPAPGGRSGRQLRDQVIRLRLLHGNLYGVRGSVVQRMRSRGIKLPVGYIGEDGLMTSLMKWNLDPLGSWQDERITACEDAQYSYRSLSIYSVSNIKTYLRRRVNYSLRYWQHELLRDALRARGLAGIPAHAEALYEPSHVLHFKPRRGSNFFFDRVAIRRMRDEFPATPH